MEKYLLGIDIGGTSVKLGIFDRDGQLLKKWEIPTKSAGKEANIFNDIAESVQNKFLSTEINWQSVVGIGVGVPGPVMENGFVSRCVNLGWENINVIDSMRSITGVDVIAAINDAKAAALGEWWKGGHDSCRSAVMITLGTGIGGGVIVDGKIVSGAFGGAGELSHFPIFPDETEPCACGKFGHLQQYASAEGIVNQYKKKLCTADHSSLLPEDENITAKYIIDSAKDGDDLSMEVVNDAVRKIAQTMAMISTVIDPELYLIGGGLSKAGDFLLDAIRIEFRRFAMFISENARIEAAVLGYDAGIYGAVKCVLDRLSDDSNK